MLVLPGMIRPMTENEPITPEEIEGQEGEPLPEREEMAVVSPTGEDAFLDLELGGDPPAGVDQ
jgi:hypothetical protein